MRSSLLKANLTMIVALIAGTWIWLAIIWGPVTDAYVASYFAAIPTRATTPDNSAPLVPTPIPVSPTQVAMEQIEQGVAIMILMILLTGAFPIGVTSLVLGSNGERPFWRSFWSMMGCYGIGIGLLTLLGGLEVYKALLFIASLFPIPFLICLAVGSVLLTNVGWIISEEWSKRETPVVPSES